MISITKPLDPGKSEVCNNGTHINDLEVKQTQAAQER